MSPTFEASAWPATRSSSSATLAASWVSCTSVVRVSSSVIDQVGASASASSCSCISAAATVIGWPRSMVDVLLLMGPIPAPGTDNRAPIPRLDLT
jgi:hypothetical protein